MKFFKRPNLVTPGSKNGHGMLSEVVKACDEVIARYQIDRDDGMYEIIKFFVFAAFKEYPREDWPAMLGEIMDEYQKKVEKK